MNQKEIADKITNLEQAFWDGYGALTRACQKTYVNPFLKANNLKLDTGMGSCTVETVDGCIRFYEKNDREFFPRPESDEEWKRLDALYQAIIALPGWDDLWYILSLRSSFEDRRMCMGASMEPYDPSKETV